MVLLEFSAAFDTIDHDQLLTRLPSHYGISEIALKWFSSYLNDRSQSVGIKEAIVCRILSPWNLMFRKDQLLVPFFLFYSLLRFWMSSLHTVLNGLW